jgi:hypothetical protein
MLCGAGLQNQNQELGVFGVFRVGSSTADLQAFGQREEPTSKDKVIVLYSNLFAICSSALNNRTSLRLYFIS